MMQSAVSFGYKSSWLAINDRAAGDVADALRLGQTQSVSWPDGVRIAYAGGVLVTPAILGWTFAVASAGSVLPDPSSPGFVDWLARLSQRLGLVQYFATYRVVELHAWARAEHGVVDRLYCYLGESGSVVADVGARTPAEVELGIASPAGRGADRGGPPDEGAVMRLAGLWSVDPSQLDGVNVPGMCSVGYP